MLDIKNLHVEVEGKEILKGVNLCIPSGEVHAIMGPNGSGKSTLAYAITGHPRYQVSQGEVVFNGENLLKLNIEERARNGIFLSFQYPIEITGITNINLIKAAYNAQKKSRGEQGLDAMDFIALVKEKLKMVKMDESLLYRSINEGFSGGEKKRNEILQMVILEPLLGILDETDSGLDIDALKVVADGVNAMRNKDRSFMLITHYQRLLDYIVPNKVHVMVDGKIIKSGDCNLAIELEKSGYEQFNVPVLQESLYQDHHI